MKSARIRAQAIQIVTILLFASLFIGSVCAVYLVGNRATTVKRTGAVTGASVVFASSAALFLLYRPLASTFQDFIARGDISKIDNLASFADLRLLPFGLSSIGSDLFAFYGWSAFTLLCLAALAAILARRGLRHEFK